MGEIAVIVMAFLGPALVYLTRYVVKGRTPTAMRLWFVSVCSFVVYYLLANGAVLDAKIAPYYLALLWPIPAILTFWLVEKLAAAAKTESPIHMFKWVTFFLSGFIFAFIMDTAASALNWYSYNTAAVTANLITNPFSGQEVPGMILLMLSLMLMGVYYLSDTFFRTLRQKVRSNTSATYLLIAAAFILGGVMWVLGDLVMRPIR